MGEPRRPRDAVAPADQAYVLGAAVRYQLPRQTYGSGIVADAVVAAAPALAPGDRATIARDLRDALAAGHAGAACDREAWTRALAALEPPPRPDRPADAALGPPHP